MRILRIAGAFALLATAVGLGCSDKQEAAKGQLMVALQTDMALPKDVDSVRVEVLSYGSAQFANTYQVGQGALLIPATLALVAGEDPSRPVTIRVIALQQGKARMLRETITTIPPDRIATLRMPIQWLCDGSAVESSPGQYTSNCPEGQTCVGGRCTDKTVSALSLPGYDPALVFGGGTGDGSGACFDTEGCFGSQPLAELKASDCSVARPSGGKANVALIPSGKKDGICDGSRCYVPLDLSEEDGFRESNGRLLLPPRVCEQITAGKLDGVVVSTTCETKTSATPPCGAWSSVNKAPTTTPSLEKACQGFSEALCGYATRCDPKWLGYFGAQSCTGNAVTYCKTLAALDSGFTPSVIEQIGLTFGSTTSCVSLDALMFSELRPRGTRAQGEGCQTGFQCASAYCAVQEAGACGQCEPVSAGEFPVSSRKQGESCLSILDCESGLLCSGGVCLPEQPEGASCSPQKPCELGWSCLATGDLATCRPPSAQENQPCQPWFYGVEEPVLPELAQHTDCDPSKGLSCVNGVCKKLPAVGQPCLADAFDTWSCLGGYCAEQGEGVVCKPFLAAGSSCSDDGQCAWPTACLGGTCQNAQVQECSSGAGGAGGSGGAGGTGGAGGSGGDACVTCAEAECGEYLTLCKNTPACNEAQACMLAKCQGLPDTTELYACAVSQCGLNVANLPEGLLPLANCIGASCASGQCIGSAGGDTDGDGVLDVADNCVDLANPDQLDTDTDGQGNTCDDDDDGDTVPDSTDNCPLVSNADQSNMDQDALGDACDPTPSGNGGAGGSPSACADPLDCSGMFANAVPTCQDNQCVLGPCLPGYLNKDGKPDNGCEVFCEGGGVEICDNGLDDDCNGKIDDCVD